MRYAVVPLVILAVSALIIGFTSGSHDKQQSLADRVNQACKPGYVVNDWTTGDEYSPVPEGTVKVTCSRTTEPFDLYYVAVAR